jgi:hypothetical protein
MFLPRCSKAVGRIVGIDLSPVVRNAPFNFHPRQDASGPSVIFMLPTDSRDALLLSVNIGMIR